MDTQAYLYFPGCKMNRFLPQYDMSIRAVLSELNITLDETELNCCGYPVRHENFAAAMTAAARNLALADAKRLPIMTPCKCCYGNLKHADYPQKSDKLLPAILYPQLLGTAMGLSSDGLGLTINKIAWAPDQPPA